MKENTVPAAQALFLHDLITPTEQGIASRVLARTDGGNVTLFAFDQGQGLSEHSAPYDALVMVLEGELVLTIGGEPVIARPGALVRMPANIPHAVDAQQTSRMLLTMLKTLKTQG
ncbi:cupin domain-containing protein [Pectobacterium cacticida]|uniref:Cupin domain-containing protein n=1 Tax=Pectobacterium cacticida TaxID=69221 RepID=A0ABZ2G6H1_9GAMM|nr:cupin domain-containing protein [Pectobacterium cacticida]UYX08325.1 cupin domain-containing protein [Pectobacterium cacticida]